MSPIQLLYHPQLVLGGEVSHISHTDAPYISHLSQIWRLVTCFMFFGPVGISLVFNMLFLYRFCRKLEETSFAGNTAGFIIMLLFGASITVVSVFVECVCLVTPHTLKVIGTLLVRMLFMGEALTTMLVYVWCRRNPFVRYSFFGLFTFQAPYLPWLLILLSVLFGGSVLADLVGGSHHTHPSHITHTHTAGIAVGHVYYFLEDVFPIKPGGFKILKTPAFL